jgi:hypothetical protein
LERLGTTKVRVGVFAQLDYFLFADQPDGEPSGLHQASPATANQLNDFVRSRQPARLLLGVDFLLVNENV